MSERLVVTSKDDELRFEVHAKPRAKRTAILGVRPGGALDVALAAPPVDGAANEALVAALASTVGVSKSSVRVVRGQSSRTKLIAVVGVAEAELRERLEPR